MSSSKKETSASKKALFSSSVSFALPDDVSTPSSLLCSRHDQTVSVERRESGRSLNSHAISTPNSSLRIEMPDHNSLMLLPPSQTMKETLVALSISTSTQLQTVWDLIGYSPEERADQLTELFSGFQRLSEEKISLETLVAKNYEETIASHKEEIKATSIALKIDVDYSLLEEHSGHTLQDEVMTLEDELENLRTVAEIAKNDLCEYRDNLLIAYQSLGLDLEECWQDVTSDLTKSRCDEYKHKVREMEEVVATRSSAIVQLVKDCKELIVTLKCDPQMSELDYRITNSLIEGKDGSIMIKSNSQSDTCTGISSKSLDELTNRVSELNGEKRRRRGILTQMGADIGELWEKLHVPMEEKKAFTDSISGLGMDTLEKGDKELNRLNELKSEMMGNLVLEAREKIQKLWDETNANGSPRDSCDGLKEDDESNFTDELLAEHEEFIKVLKSRLEQMRPLLIMIEKREAIVSERMEYEGLQKDPERFQQRGSALTKQLMKEEKMSRRIKKDLPKYTEHLEKKLKDWAETNNESFLYKGEAYMCTIKRQEDEWHNYKEKQTQMKQLKKKQQEKAEKISSKKVYQPLPGKKKLMPAPLSDATNKPRAVSRGRATFDKMGKKATSKCIRPASRP